MGEVKPAKKWIIPPVIVLVAGIVLMIFGVSGTFGGMLSEKAPIYPGATVTVEQEGRYGIYYEYRFAYGLYEDVAFIFIDRDNQRYESRFPTSSSTYTVNGVSGELIAVVDLVPGVYTVETTQQDSELTFVMGEASTGAMVSGIFCMVGGTMLMAFSIIALIIILVIRAVNRRKLRQNPYYNQ